MWSAKSLDINGGHRTPLYLVLSKVAWNSVPLFYSDTTNPGEVIEYKFTIIIWVNFFPAAEGKKKKGLSVLVDCHFGYLTKIQIKPRLFIYRWQETLIKMAVIS